MKALLALDASTTTCSVAVQIGDQIVQRTQDVSRKHSQFILSMIDGCLKEANIELSDLKALVFGQGPGSFTGLRLVASIIQAIAFSHSLPVISISSLQALSQTAYLQNGCSNVVVCEDARIKEVYWAHYHCVDGLMQPITEETCTAVFELTQYLSSLTQSYSLVGSGWQAYEDLKRLSDTKGYFEIASMATGLLTLGEHAFANQAFVSPELALPSYIQMLQYQKYSF